METLLQPESVGAEARSVSEILAKSNPAGIPALRTSLSFLTSAGAELATALEKREQELAREKGEQKEIAWGSQIRSYVLAPYTLVKDHRTNFEKGNVEAVLNGAIDDLIREYVWQRSTGKLGIRSA